MYRLTLHRIRADHFLVLAIFPFRDADFVDIEYSVCLHSLDIFSEAVYRFVQESTWHFESRIFLTYIFHVD
jgi:hypothetical protein